MAKVVMQDSQTARGPWISTLIRGLIVAVAGGFIAFFPDDFIRLITVSIGGWMVLAGIYSLVQAFRIGDDKRRKNVSLVRALLNIVIGTLAIAMPFMIARTWWIVLLFVVGVQLIISAALEIMIGIRLRRGGLPAGSAFLGAFISVAIAVILFLAPEFLGATLVRGTGIVIALLGIGMMAFGFRQRK